MGAGGVWVGPGKGGVVKAGLRGNGWGVQGVAYWFLLGEGTRVVVMAVFFPLTACCPFGLCLLF